MTQLEVAIRSKLWFADDALRSRTSSRLQRDLEAIITANVRSFQVGSVDKVSFSLAATAAPTVATPAPTAATRRRLAGAASSVSFEAHVSTFFYGTSFSGDPAGRAEDVVATFSRDLGAVVARNWTDATLGTAFATSAVDVNASLAALGASRVNFTVVSTESPSKSGGASNAFRDYAVFFVPIALVLVCLVCLGCAYALAQTVTCGRCRGGLGAVYPFAGVLPPQPAACYQETKWSFEE